MSNAPDFRLAPADAVQQTEAFKSDIEELRATMVTPEAQSLNDAVASIPKLMAQVADLTAGINSSAKRIESAMPALKARHDQLAGAADMIETAAGTKSNGGP